MRLDPIMIVVCDNPDCLGLPSDSKEIIRAQMAISCGWARGSLDDYVDRVLKVSGWNVLPDEDFCPKCFGKEKENGNTNETGATSEAPTEDSSANRDSSSEGDKRLIRTTDLRSLLGRRIYCPC